MGRRTALRGTSHWWSDLEGDISYLIFRADPDNRLPVREPDTF
jgi:hypothetical protein